VFVRVTRVKRGDKVYEYPQLVRSYRRKSDGRSTQEVVCSLKDWSKLEIQNLKRALEASRNDEQVVLQPQVANALDGARIVANLQYLDVAVLHRLWQSCGLDDVLDGLVDDDNWDVDFVSVVLSLVIQRCVAPGSKSFATRWFPRSALGELLGVEPSKFNNSRVHRVLDALEAVEEAIATHLPCHLRHREGRFATIFLDVTDTWFEGCGPEMATRGKTKEGMVRKKVGIVLMCNEKGYPVAWKTVAGDAADQPAMLSLLDAVQDADWIHQVPVVVDRAMGTTQTLRDLYERDVSFVCALRRSEFSSYTNGIPSEDFIDIDVEDVDEEEAIRRVCEIADRTKMERLADGTYVLDVGRISKEESNPRPYAPVETDSDNPVVQYLAEAEQLNKGLDEGKWASLKEAAEHFGYSKGWASARSVLRRIADDIQHDLCADAAPRLSLTKLVELSQMSVDDQREHYQQLKHESSHRCPPTSVSSGSAPSQKRLARQRQQDALWVHGVVAFCPELFVDQRRNGRETLNQLYGLVADLNVRARTHGRLTAEGMEKTVSERLQKKDLVNAFELEVEYTDAGAPQLALKMNDEKWNGRRRYDGFSLLVAHPDRNLSAARIHQLYRGKHVVESDFRVIKSFVKLRPMYHQTDAKIRAHVIVCVLALLLERALTDQLRSLGLTAQRALESLASCRLNRVELAADPSLPVYTVTEPTTEQRAILRHLDMMDLVEDECVQEAIVGRYPLL
jgi:transposase